MRNEKLTQPRTVVELEADISRLQGTRTDLSAKKEECKARVDTLTRQLEQIEKTIWFGEANRADLDKPRIEISDTNIEIEALESQLRGADAALVLRTTELADLRAAITAEAENRARQEARRAIATAGAALIEAACGFLATWHKYGGGGLLHDWGTRMSRRSVASAFAAAKLRTIGFELFTQQSDFLRGCVDDLRSEAPDLITPAMTEYTENCQAAVAARAKPQIDAQEANRQHLKKADALDRSMRSAMAMAGQEQQAQRSEIR